MKCFSKIPDIIYRVSTGDIYAVLVCLALEDSQAIPSHIRHYIGIWSNSSSFQYFFMFSAPRSCTFTTLVVDYRPGSRSLGAYLLIQVLKENRSPAV